MTSSQPQLPHGVVLYHGVLNPDLCSRVIDYFESHSKTPTNEGPLPSLLNGKPRSFTEIILDDETMVNDRVLNVVYKRIRRTMDRYFDETIAHPGLREEIKAGCYSLEPRLKRYDVGSDFPLHSDDASVVALTRRFAHLLYLNDNLEGGATVFRSGTGEVARVQPVEGAMLVFPIHPVYMHEGQKIERGSKYLLNGFATVLTSQARVQTPEGVKLPKLTGVLAEIGTLSQELVEAARKIFPGK